MLHNMAWYFHEDIKRIEKELNKIGDIPGEMEKCHQIFNEISKKNQ